MNDIWLLITVITIVVSNGKHNVYITFIQVYNYIYIITCIMYVNYIYADTYMDTVYTQYQFKPIADHTIIFFSIVLLLNDNCLV